MDAWKNLHIMYPNLIRQTTSGKSIPFPSIIKELSGVESIISIALNDLDQYYSSNEIQKPAARITK